MEYTSQQHVPGLQDVPHDVLQRNILALLDPQTLCAFRLSSTYGKSVVDEEGLWMQLGADLRPVLGQPEAWLCKSYRELYQQVLYKYGALLRTPLFLALHAPFGGLLVCRAEPPVLKLYSLIPYRLNLPPALNHVWTIWPTSRPPPASPQPSMSDLGESPPQQSPERRPMHPTVTCSQASTEVAGKLHDAAFAWQPLTFTHPCAAHNAGRQEPWWAWWMQAGGKSAVSPLAVFCCYEARSCRHVDEDPLRRWATPQRGLVPNLPLLIPDVSSEVAHLQNQFFLLNHVTYLFSNGQDEPRFPGLAEALAGAPPPSPKPSIWGRVPSRYQLARLPPDWHERALLYAPLELSHLAGHPLAGLWTGSYGGHGVECVAVIVVPVSVQMKLWVQSGSADMLGAAVNGAGDAVALAAAMAAGPAAADADGGGGGSAAGSATAGSGGAAAAEPAAAEQQGHASAPLLAGAAGNISVVAGSGPQGGPTAESQGLPTPAAGLTGFDEEMEEVHAEVTSGMPESLEDLSETLAMQGPRCSAILRGIKLLGDTNVPAGHVSFEVAVDEEGAGSAMHAGVRWEVGEPYRMPPGYRSIVDISPTESASQQLAGSPRVGRLIIRSIHKGRGQIAGTGYKQPKWSALDLLEFDLQDPSGVINTIPSAAFGLCWHELSSVSIFSKLHVP